MGSFSSKLTDGLGQKSIESLSDEELDFAKALISQSPTGFQPETSDKNDYEASPAP